MSSWAKNLCTPVKDASQARAAPVAEDDVEASDRASAFRPDLGGVLSRRRRVVYGKQQSLSDEIGIARETLIRVEGGRTKPSPDTVDQLLRLLHLNWKDVAVVGPPDRPSRHFDGRSRGEISNRLCEQLRKGRKAERCTLRQLATRIGVSPAQLSRIERDDGPRSGLYEDHPDDPGLPREFGRLRFRHPELRRLSSS